MYSRDANEATWYMLRYATDFAPRAPHPDIPAWQSPLLGEELFYDPGRHVLELLPERPARAIEPLPGLMAGVTGEVYRVDPSTFALLVRRCDGTEQELVCERGVLVQPCGLALDDRGLLYVADPAAKRVVVLWPRDGSIVAVLAQGLDEPVDVAVAPDGRIYCADRAAERVVVFDSRFRHRSDFTARSTRGGPEEPRPIAVMVDADGSILVADAAHPRLLRFDPAGEPLGDVELHERARALEGSVSLDALDRAVRVASPRLSRARATRIAEVHRAIRLLRLRLGRRFETCGTFVSAALDGGTAGVVWHKITLDADLPPGTWLKVQTVTSDDPGRLQDPLSLPTRRPDPEPSPEVLYFAPDEDPAGAVKPRAPSDVPDRLVQSPPGRHLRLRLQLGSDGTSTPSIRSIRISYPRHVYLDLLPRVFRRDPDAALFIEHFLALFEHVFTGIEDRYELFSRELNPDAAPPEVIRWLGCLIDLTFDPSWPLERRRALVAAAMELYRTRGTIRGIERYVEIYTGIRPTIIEGFLERPGRPPFLGTRGSILGCATALAPPDRDALPEEALWSRYAHRFTVLVYLDGSCDEDVTLAVVDRIVQTNKPAHAVHRLRVVRPDARVGLAQVGMDLVLGGSDTPQMQIGVQAEPGGPREQAGLLGVNSILGGEPARGVPPLLPEL